MKKLIKQHDKIINSLDFSGGKGSFFDFWHIHYDFNGKGNKSIKERLKYLQEAFRIYDALAKKLERFPHNYQLWIGIDEEESGDDGVYIHSPNPNSDYFPHLVKNERIETFKNIELRDFLYKSGFEIIESINFDTNYYILYKKEIGIDLKD